MRISGLFGQHLSLGLGPVILSDSNSEENMAITIRTLVTNPAAAAVAAWTILGVSILGTQLDLGDAAGAPCSSRTPVSEYDYYSKVQCLADAGELEAARELGVRAVGYFPRSEALNNQLGIVYIQMERFQEAGVVLARALRVIEPTTATMENNLAWATLWAPSLSVHSQRNLYKRALHKEPLLCEALHTGMMVEWRAARQAEPFEQVEAISEFTRLADRYVRCARGAEGTVEDRAMEELSVVSALADMDRMLDTGFSTMTGRTVRNVTSQLTTLGLDAERSCERAVPSMVDATAVCVQTLEEHGEVATFRRR